MVKTLLCRVSWIAFIILTESAFADIVWYVHACPTMLIIHLRTCRYISPPSLVYSVTVYVFALQK